MEKQHIVMEQFQALRSEIEAIKARLFRTVCLGLVLVPVLAYLAEKPGTVFLGLALPFVILVLNMLYVSQEHALLRCGRYMRQRIEPLIEEGAGWEAWLEAHPGLRVMDKCMFWCFVIIFFLFYFGAVGLAITKLPEGSDEVLGTEYRIYLACAAYALGAIWMAISVWFYWRSRLK